MQHSNHKQKKFIVITIVVLVLLALCVGGAAWKKSKSDIAQINKDQYQAIFLTNGQVYFGKLSGTDKDTYKLSDIYYLQVQQNVQPKDENKDANKDAQVSMAKLGDELHGPEDAMYIQRDQVLFWENLKDQGKVTQAIKNNKK